MINIQSWHLVGALAMAASWLDNKLGTYDALCSWLESGKKRQETQCQVVLAWFDETGIPGTKRILGTVHEAFTVELLKFGSVAAGYHIYTSDIDLVLCIDGNYCFYKADAMLHLRQMCIELLFMLTSQTTVKFDYDSPDRTQHDTVKFRYGGVKVDLRVVLNLKQFTAPYSVKWITTQYELLQKQLAQVECITWHIEQHPHLKHLLPDIIYWAKHRNLCHDGNAPCPGRIESPKACHWAFWFVLWHLLHAIVICVRKLLQPHYWLCSTWTWSPVS